MTRLEPPTSGEQRSRAPACSDWASSQHLDPAGSAGHYEGFLLVEQPLPWPGDVSGIPGLARVAAVAAAARMRLQVVMRVEGWPLGAGDHTGRAANSRSGSGLQAPDGAGSDTRRLICYRAARPGWAGPLRRVEGHADAVSLAEVATALVNSAPGGAPPDPAWPVPPPPPDPVDVLVCTHGRRDPCCGARGAELVAALMDDAIGPTPGPVRLWRTSHTGGHRFAPTVVVLPQATMWAWADVALLRVVVGAEAPPGGAVDRYRGCAVLGPPAHQVLERAVLVEVGWSLLASWRRVRDLGDDRFRLESEPGGTWEATVTGSRRVPQPDCRTDPALAAKQSVEFEVKDLRRVIPA